MKNEWIKVERSKPKQYALLAVLLKNGDYVVRRGCHVAKFEEETSHEDFYDYNEADDTYYIPEGWYEAISNWDEWAMVVISEGVVTHWMPLPSPPSLEPLDIVGNTDNTT